MSRGAVRAAAAWSGLLCVDKPVGVTSHDVVARARRALAERAIGHLGTLDPGASGLLVLAVGAATRCALVWQGGGKTYVGRARFGVVTDTQDIHGRTLAEHPVTLAPEQLVAATDDGFVGDLQQVPPMVSALKHAGEALHRIARRGETVPREPRAIRVESWRWTAFALPQAEFEIRCSGGTYVRTLVHDLGARLGCGATLAALRRTRSEPFDLARAVAWADLVPGATERLRALGLGLDEALAVLPAIPLDATDVVRVRQGQRPRVDPRGVPVAAGARSIVFRDELGHAVAIGELCRTEEGVCACPHVVFPARAGAGVGA